MAEAVTEQSAEHDPGAPMIIVRSRESEKIRKEKYGAVVEGPNGLKMPEFLARAIDTAKKSAPKEVEIPFRRLAANAEQFDLDKSSRTDVSYITTDAIDRDREVVLPIGMDARQYNGVVTWAHQYDVLPMGRNQWIKPKNNGLIAKTAYAPKPKDWSGDWFADAILSLMQMDPPTCTGKSIGFIPTAYRSPTLDEIRARPELAECRAIIPTWQLMEYAVAPVPANPEAEMLEVSKSWSAEDSEIYAAAIKSVTPIIIAAKKEIAAQKEIVPIAPFVTQETINKILAERLAEHRKQLSGQLGKRAADALQDRLHQMMGTP